MANLARTLVVIESNSGSAFALEKIGDGTLKLLHDADHIETASEIASFDAGMLNITDVRKAAAQCHHSHDRDEFAKELYIALQAADQPKAVSPSLSPAPSPLPSLSPPWVPTTTRWPIPPRYKLGIELGSGSYGCVRQAWDEEGQRKVAVKEVMLSTMDNTDQTRILRELKLLSGMQHSHIIQIFDVCYSEEKNGTVYMIMELCDADLNKVLKSGQGLSLHQTRVLAYNLCVGVNYLHANGVYHRDLKPGNCLANKDLSVKICDFNLAKFVGHEGSHSESSVAQPFQRNLTRHVVTRWYRAPEVILQLPYTKALDVWSFGCILAELFRALNKTMFPRSGPLFPGGRTAMSCGHQSDGDQLDKIIEVLGSPMNEPQFAALPRPAKDQINRYGVREGTKVRDQVPPESSDEGKDLLCDSLKFFPEVRITMADALLHHFFDKVKRCSTEIVEDCELIFDFDESKLQKRTDFVQEFKKEANQFNS